MSTAPNHGHGKKEEEHKPKTAITPADPRNKALADEVKSALTKIADCSQRITDNLPAHEQPFRDPGYVANQLVHLLAAAEGLQRSLAAHYSQKNATSVEKLKEGKETA